MLPAALFLMSQRVAMTYYLRYNNQACRCFLRLLKHRAYNLSPLSGKSSGMSGNARQKM